jgi:nucleotide-binding universal stress UspA family protein
MTPFSKILAPVDFSPGSQASVEYAVTLAKALHCAVTLLYVYQRPDLMEAIVPGADNALDLVADRALVTKRLETMGGEATKRTDVEVHALVVPGSPAAEILSLASTQGFGMIVMGTHGRTGLPHLLMGSVTEAVVRGAGCPVLTSHLPFPAS